MGASQRDLRIFCIHVLSVPPEAARRTSAPNPSSRGIYPPHSMKNCIALPKVCGTAEWLYRNDVARPEKNSIAEYTKKNDPIPRLAIQRSPLRILSMRLASQES